MKHRCLLEKLNASNQLAVFSVLFKDWDFVNVLHVWKMNCSLTFETPNLVKYVPSSKAALLWNGWITFFYPSFWKAMQEMFL